MKRKYWMYALLVVPFLWMACNDDSNNNDQNIEPGFTKSDKAFIEAAAKLNLVEIELSQLAVSQGRDSITRLFAQSMVDEHTMAQNELKAIADTHASVQWPQGLLDFYQGAKDTLASMSGYPFDSHYMSEIIGIHRDALPVYESGAGASKDAATKAYAAKYWPIMEEHLAVADSVATEIQTRWENQSDTTNTSSGRMNQ